MLAFCARHLEIQDGPSLRYDQIHLAVSPCSFEGHLNVLVVGHEDVVAILVDVAHSEGVVDGFACADFDFFGDLF